MRSSLITLTRLARIPAVLFVIAALALMPLRPAAAEDLSQAYLLPDLFEIMAEEGRHSALEDGSATLQGRALAELNRAIEAIYDPARMHDAFVAVLTAELEAAPDVVEDALEFARSPLGQEILQLEISARRALLDDEVDEIARLALAEARGPRAPAAKSARLEMVRARVDANDLVELNVSLGLNSSLAYYSGLMSGNAPNAVGPEDLLQMVWMQEPAIRAEIEDWVESYFLLSYQPLSDEDLQAYIDYVSTPLAQSFNRAMFRAFDVVFSDISLAVGTVMGRGLMSEEL